MTAGPTQLQFIVAMVIAATIVFSFLFFVILLPIMVASNKRKAYDRRQANLSPEDKAMEAALRAHYEKGRPSYARHARPSVAPAAPAVKHRTNDPKVREQVFNKANGQCAICSTTLNVHGWHIDHIYPKSRGGPDHIDNYQPTCPRCNMSKGAGL